MEHIAPSADERLAAALESELLPAVPPGTRLSAAALRLDGGGHAAYGPERAYEAASVVKVDILGALLLRARDEGRAPTARERDLAAAMIERSDNDSATALWEEAGGAAGLDAALARLGLSATRASSSWGLTATTVGDRLALLRAVFTEDTKDTVLDARSRAWARHLMGRVVAEQAWGVSAAGTAALKNGWLPRPPEGLWVVNSVGHVTADGRPCLVAVLSDGHASLADGISVVERAARAAVRAVRA